MTDMGTQLSRHSNYYVYLSGPMTGLPELNFPAFRAASKDIRAHGWKVFSPAETDGGDTLKSRPHYMRQDVGALLEVDAVVVLPGWQNSAGARLEVAIARELGLELITYPTMGPLLEVDEEPDVAPTRASIFPEAAEVRKQRPVASGVLDYFPDAFVEIAHVSWVGNEQHNPGEYLHWARGKSSDEGDALIRHFLQRGGIDTDGTRHSAKMAWRALALLQKEVELDRESA